MARVSLRWALVGLTSLAVLGLGVNYDALNGKPVLDLVSDLPKSALEAVSVPPSIKEVLLPAMPYVPVARAEQVSDTALRVWWPKVPGAKSYLIYQETAYDWERVKVTTASSWVNKKLPPNRVQRYQVTACAGPDGTGGCGFFGRTVSAITAVPSGRTNVGDLRLTATPRQDLGLHDTWTIGVELAVRKGGPDGGVFSRRVRFVSSDPAVVKVPAVGKVSEDSTEKVTAKLAAVGYGSATITAIAHNGRSKSFSVTVKDMTASIAAEMSGDQGRKHPLGDCEGPFARLAKEVVENQGGFARARFGLDPFNLDPGGRRIVSLAGTAATLSAQAEEAVMAALSCGARPVEVDFGPRSVVFRRIVEFGSPSRPPRIDLIVYRMINYDDLEWEPPASHWTVLFEPPIANDVIVPEQ